MSEMTVGSIRTTVNPPLASGIYEALLEKAERENAELADRLSGLELSTTQKLAELERELNNMQDQRDFAMTVIKDLEKERDSYKEMWESWRTENFQNLNKIAELTENFKKIREDYAIADVYAANVHAELMEARKEGEEQARLLGKGSEREARLATERDHYKQALEEISTTIQEYKDSMVQEPAEDFIHAIKAWADKKLKEL
jgi:septal ring factor EnvC (AmiA/AmiB activator)